ncbi:unnamed protein product [Rotaria sordida]|uniref:ABC transporter domain-containing protein n=2 Tax=Rotaria sordida TaxID=392033 RepID=A0A814ZPN9_9BILA|nr:unnamed protein product [Rotaria sordida]CAF1528247.1 unnamed protein product [Rotaria sordida]
MNETQILEDSVAHEESININGDIHFDNVEFAYPTRPDVLVLRNLTLTARVGEITALVGSSGCGKSTCISLLLRFYEPSSGHIAIHDRSITNCNIKQLRQKIGVVSQEPILFATSIYENIRFGKENATRIEIEEAARQANAHDFIMQLPNKYDTVVGERGVQLSGGEKQRVALARALVKQPALLLLDEATSALDNANEKIVQEALDRACKGQRVALIGVSGSGKSTVTQLLERFYDPIQGRICFDGVDIRKLNIQWLRSCLGLVSQEPILFDMTIAENIAYGRDNTSIEDIIDAATKANIHHFIQQLPQGYETKVGMKGGHLSGGEKQRIAIARALLRRPKVLLLDEATSAMDSYNEQIVQEALERAQADDPSRTSLIIAHPQAVDIVPRNNHQRTTRKLSSKIKNSIILFYSRDDISYQMPGKRDTIVVNDNGNKITYQKKILLYTIREAYELFLAANPGISVSQTAFAEIRPKHISVKSSMAHRVCISIYHENVNLLLNSLSKHVNGSFCSNLYSFTSALVCDESNYDFMSSNCFTCENYFDLNIKNNVIDRHIQIK